MIYALIILGILIFGTALIFLVRKFENKSQLILKILGVVFLGLYFSRLLNRMDVIDSVVNLETTMLPKPMLVFLVILRWLTLVSVIFTILTPFFPKVKTLKNLQAFFTPFIVILNIVFFKENVISFEGVANYTGFKAIQFAFEVGLMGVFSANYLYQKIAKKDWKNIKEELKIMSAIIPMAILSVVPMTTFRILFGETFGVADDFELTHRIMLYITFIFPIVAFAVFRRKEYDVKKAAIMFMVFAAFISYNYTQSVLDYTWSELPFHLCHTAVFLMLISFPFNIKSIFFFNYFVNVIGAFIAMLMPNVSSQITETHALRFWAYHSYDMSLPILAVLFGLFPRPKFKMMSGAIMIFTIYFISMMFLNGYVNTFSSVDYFFLYGDVISDKIGFLKDIQAHNQWLIPLGNGTSMIVFWLYDILIYIGFVFFMFMVWLVYVSIFKVQDHYVELVQIRRQDVLEMKKFKKQLKGRPLSSPFNLEGVHMINISHFSKVYGNNKFKTVDDFNLQVNTGEVFGFIGHNGAGKSTLIKSMVGIQSITEGKIEICGYDIEKQPLEAKSKIGYVSDNHAVYENLTGREYINYVADLYYVSKEDRDERLEKYAKIFNLTNAIDNQIKSYSHGMKQKLVVIAAIIHDPKVWILDEPLTGLDPTSAYEIKDCMRAHANKGNIVFFSSHVIEVVAKICDRIAIIQNGILVGVFDIKEMAKKGVDLEELYLCYIEKNEENQKNILCKITNQIKVNENAKKTNVKKVDQNDVSKNDAIEVKKTIKKKLKLVKKNQPKKSEN